jgi:hypothetical protein
VARKPVLRWSLTGEESEHAEVVLLLTGKHMPTSRKSNEVAVLDGRLMGKNESTLAHGVITKGIRGCRH